MASSLAARMRLSRGSVTNCSWCLCKCHVAVASATEGPVRVVPRRSIATSSALKIHLPKITVQPSEEVKKVFEQENYKPKLSPGHFHVKKVCLPSKFVDAAEKIMTERSVQGDVKAKATDLYNYLWNRKPPIEELEYNGKAMEVEQMFKAPTTIIEPFLSEKEKKRLEDSQYNKTKRRLKRLIYHWEPINYTQSTAFQYLVARTPGEYAALYRIFYEISKRDPEFAPKSLFDFGSGVGSVVWAANEFWGKSLKEHMCIDVSEEMASVADLLFRRGSSSRPTEFQGISFRKALPASVHRKYDVVVSSNTMLELSSLKERIETLDILWKKTEKYLVLVELGTNAGFRVLNQLRDYLLQVHIEDFELSECPDFEVGHLFGPCPHDVSCPRVNTDKTPCNFKIRYNTLMPFSRPQEGIEIFSYLAFRKGTREKTDTCWPRIVRSPLPRPRHVICRLCTKKGKLAEVVLTKAKTSKELYRTARKSLWGDLLPVDQFKEDNQTLDDVINDGKVPDDEK